jgi:hypothetical protein
LPAVRQLHKQSRCMRKRSGGGGGFRADYLTPKDCIVRAPAR